MRWSCWCVCIACLLCHAQAQRPAECGDFVVNGVEVCDDGNLVDGDGCSSTCTIEAGFMCSGFGRAVETELGLGLVQDNAGAYSLSGPAEACLGTELCAIGGLWQPELWTGAASGPMPPRAYYCGTTCNGFGEFTGLQHDGACQLEDRNECVRGEAACDWHSVCENTVYGAGDQGLGYRCRCDRHHFVVSAQGQACALSGAELVLRVIGAAAYDAQAVPPADMAGLLTMRARFVDHLISKGVTRTGANVDDTRAALLEGVLEHDPELLEVIADTATGYAGHALWAVKVRMALELCNPSALMNLLSTDVALGAGLDAVFTGLDLRVRARGVCSTDVSRECASDADCLSAGTCRSGVPDVRVAVLDAGGSLSPVTVTSGGLQVLSVVYDPVQTAWQARVRYAKSDLAGAMSVLYLSHVTPPVSAIEQATFRVSEFPCQPVGVNEFELDRSDTVCCLQTFNARYTPTQGFADYLAATPALTCPGAGPGAAPPPNATRTLLAGAGDFVAGSFVNTARSSATLDLVQSTEGYQDVLLHLAEEDMRSVGGIEHKLPGGFRLRFFVGLAHFHGAELCLALRALLVLSVGWRVRGCLAFCADSIELGL